MPTRRNRNVSAKRERHMWRGGERTTTMLPGCPRTLKSEPAILNSSRLSEAAESEREGACGYPYPRLIFQMSKDRGQTRQYCWYLMLQLCIFQGSSWREILFFLFRRFFFFFFAFAAVSSLFVFAELWIWNRSSNSSLIHDYKILRSKIRSNLILIKIPFHRFPKYQFYDQVK